MALKVTDFIFHSDLVPLSYPAKVSTTISSGTQLNAGQSRTTYGSWLSTSPGSLGVNAFFTIGGKTYPDFVQEHLLKSPGSFPKMNVWVEKNSSNQVRAVMREFNDDSVAHTYTKADVNITFYMVHII